MQPPSTDATLSGLRRYYLDHPHPRVAKAQPWAQIRQRFQRLSAQQFSANHLKPSAIRCDPSRQWTLLAELPSRLYPNNAVTKLTMQESPLEPVKPIASGEAAPALKIDPLLEPLWQSITSIGSTTAVRTDDGAETLAHCFNRYSL